MTSEAHKAGLSNYYVESSLSLSTLAASLPLNTETSTHKAKNITNMPAISTPQIEEVLGSQTPIMN